MKKMLEQIMSVKVEHPLNDLDSSKDPNLQDNRFVNNIQQNFLLNNYYQQHGLANNHQNSAFMPYYSQVNSGMNYYYYCLYNQLYLKQLMESMKMTSDVNSNLNSLNSPSNMTDHPDTPKYRHSLLMSNLSSSSTMESAYLNKPRERSVKNNKLVYVHSKKNSSGKKFSQGKLSCLKAAVKSTAEGVQVKSGKSRGSKYRGVSRNGNQWQVLIMVNKKKRYIGSFSSEEEASRAYDKVSLQYHGSKAKTNHPYTEEDMQMIVNGPKFLFKERDEM